MTPFAKATTRIVAWATGENRSTVPRCCANPEQPTTGFWLGSSGSVILICVDSGDEGLLLEALRHQVHTNQEGHAWGSRPKQGAGRKVDERMSWFLRFRMEKLRPATGMPIQLSAATVENFSFSSFSSFWVFRFDKKRKFHRQI